MKGKPPYPTILHSGILGEILTEYRPRLLEKGFQPLHEHIPLGRDELLQLAPQAVAAFGPGSGMDREFFKAARNLKVVSLMSSGWDAVDVQAATQYGVLVTIAPAQMAESVADLTWGLIIAAARQIPQRYYLLKAHQTADTHLGTLVYGKTMGIIGLGFIGKAVARRALGFNMRLLATDLDGFWDHAFAAEHQIQHSTLENQLRMSDIVSLHLRPTSQTLGFIGAQELSWMKPTAILINTARANLVDGQALYQALINGRLGGFASDVDTDNGSDISLLALPNVVCTPHIGGRSLETAYELVEQAMENALLALAGGKPESLVNPEVYDRQASLPNRSNYNENHRR